MQLRSVEFSARPALADKVLRIRTRVKTVHTVVATTVIRVQRSPITFKASQKNLSKREPASRGASPVLG